MSLCSVGEAQTQSPHPTRSRSEEMLDRWNDIGNKPIAMAPDLLEDKYDFKRKDERTFAQNLLHAAALDFVLIRRVSGSNVEPDFGEGNDPSRDAFKTKADVVKFVQEGRGRRASDSRAGRRGAGQYVEFLGIGWPTTRPSGCSPSSTAASTTASLRSAVAQITWYRRIRGGEGPGGF